MLLVPSSLMSADETDKKEEGPFPKQHEHLTKIIKKRKLNYNCSHAPYVTYCYYVLVLLIF